MLEVSGRGVVGRYDMVEEDIDTGRTGNLVGPQSPPCFQGENPRAIVKICPVDRPVHVLTRDA
jgi:hypothetical protein